MHITLKSYFLSYSWTVKLKKKCSCSISDAKQTSVVSHPYHVTFENIETKKVECSGAVVDGLWVVTGASCFGRKPNEINKLKPNLTNYRIRSGSDEYGRGGTLHIADNFERHPEYQSSVALHRFNVALVYLKQPIVFDSTRFAVRLPDPTTPPTRMVIIAPGTTGVMTGYRKTTVEHVRSAADAKLHSIAMTIMDGSSCARYLMKLKVNNKREIGEYFCATTPHDSESTSSLRACEFQDGSPLVIAERLVGIAAHLDQCLPNAPSIFLDVNSANYWLRLRMKKEQPFWVSFAVLCSDFL